MLNEMAIVPSGGNWKFLQRLPNGLYHTFSETDPEKLYAVVLEFRLNSNLPTEHLREEISRGVSAPISTRPPEGRSLRERVTAWLVNKQFGTIKYVTPEIASERAKRASQCKFNVPNYADECLECYNSTLRGLSALRQGRTTPYDDKLGACSQCGWDNRTVVHLQASSLHIDQLEHKQCWCAMLDKTPDKEVE